MPTHTPSPHRFLAGPPPSTRKPKPKPPSSLRNGFTPQTPKPTSATHNAPEPEVTKLTTAKRFVIAPPRPRTAEEPSKPDYRDEEAHSTPHAQLTPRPKPRRKFERIESIDEGSQSSPLAPPNGGNDFGVLHSIEPHHPDTDSASEDEDELLFATEARHKRRRISPSSQPPSSPALATNTRFLVPHPRTPAPFNPTTISTDPQTATAAQTTHRPSFLLPPPPTSPAKPTKPLPEIFSPSRKAQKYIPHGLASTLQAWIIEAGTTSGEEGVRRRVRVRDVQGEKGGVVFVTGEEGERFVLAGRGGRMDVKVEVGGEVGIRAPVWDVKVGDEGEWGVGVEWGVL